MYGNKFGIPNFLLVVNDCQVIINIAPPSESTTFTLKSHNNYELK